MILRKNYLILIVLISVFSCENERKQNVYNLTIDIESVSGISHSDIFKGYSIVPLETNRNTLIGEISKIILSENLIFVLDSKISNSVFIYSKNGKLVNKIESKGTGPGELFSPVNIEINEEDKELIVFDGKLGKFLYYDFKGNFLKEKRKTEIISVFDMFFQNSHFYFVDDQSEDWHSRLLVTDKNLNETKRLDTFFEGDFKIMNGKKSRYFYESHDGNGIFYKERNHNRLVKIEGNIVSNQYLFSFSSLEFEPDPARTYEAFEFSKEFWQSDKYALGDEIIDSNNYTLLSVNKGSEFKLALWEKEGNGVKMIKSIKNDMDGISPDINGIPPYNVKANYFIWALHPADLADFHGLKNQSQNPYLDFFSKYKIDLDDNPILFIYTFKD
ncbi:6-bladed beta-propeller [Cognataquiflexum rubidum]|uniref:6-bladed beta-propeller n=1 Tax=Cognataquiflexum rubidum TaxID=2922273 RepID=UPI001F13D90C|nr:6-bladed beta-propeller [Cognataquiflexum rubidum]MCH6235617.1 6-bladed beta-propeller [Cognataquiflexum rubidum]